jgi:hypothetical protein
MSYRETVARASSSVVGAEDAVSGVDDESRHGNHDDHECGQPKPADQSSACGNNHEFDPS